MTTTATDSNGSEVSAAMPRGLVLMIGYFVILATLVITIPLKLLGQIGPALGASGSLLNWVVIIGSLSGAIGTALLPPLASLFGQQRIALVTMGLLTLGSILGAFAPNMTVLLVGRFISGFTLGGIALALAIARSNLTGRTLRTVLSWIAAAEGIAAGLSFAIGGLLTDTVHVNWRVVFGVLALLGIIGVLGSLAVIPGRQGPGRGRVDWVGGLLLAAALALILVPLSMGSKWGWASPGTLVPLVAGVIVAAVWWIVEERVPAPLANTRALRNMNFLRGWLVFFLAGMLAWIVNFTLPTFTETPTSAGFGFGYDELTSGLLMLMFCCGIVVGSASAGPLSRFVPARVMCLLAFTGLAIGMLLIAFVHGSEWHLWMWPIIVGLSYGLSSASAYLTFIQALHPDEVATAASIGQISAPLGGAIGSAAITAVLTSQVIKVGHKAVPTEHSFQLGWVIGAVLSVVGLLLVALIRAPKSVVAESA
ncbi:MFS transporter [Nocardia jiangxiensis]|uniref:MFS transporter n=1 Tax=Nocardia jiangxiensis TaxID=282685 RepID=A0ABW6SDE3_9NOCA|nr:MFS transporter [Nocardia jiangxiensis]